MIFFSVKIKQKVQLIGLSLAGLLALGCFSWMIYSTIIHFNDYDAYTIKVFAGNEIYFVEKEPIKINDKCWFFESSNGERFYCGDIYVKKD